MAKTRRTGRTTAGLVAGIVLVVLGVAGAAATYTLTQTVPTTTAPAAGLTALCTSLTSDASAEVATTTDAVLVFNCGSSPAFTINTAGSPTPTFSYTGGLYLIPAGSGGTPTSTSSAGLCTDFTGNVPLTTAAPTPTILSASTGYDYCVQTTPGATVSTFTIAWA